MVAFPGSQGNPVFCRNGALGPRATFITAETHALCDPTGIVKGPINTEGSVLVQSSSFHLMPPGLSSDWMTSSST